MKGVDPPRLDSDRDPVHMETDPVGQGRGGPGVAHEGRGWLVVGLC